MGRQLRIQYEGANYHVFSRGNRREPIFRNTEDYQAFEDILLDSMRWSGVLLYNWSQMPNHFHFNVETPDGNLAEFMQRFKTRFAKYFNAAHHLVGHVFQGRYGSVVCQKEAHFKEIVRYVELNAYRLIGGRMLARFGQWRWSSLHYLLQPESQWPPGCQTAFRSVLDRFSQDPVQARGRLVEFLTDGLKDGSWEDFYRVKAKRFLGSDEFVEQIKQREKEPVRKKTRTIRRIASAEELRELTATCFDVSEMMLSHPGKGKRQSRLRQAMAYVGRQYLRLPVNRLAAVLGRQANSVSMMLARNRGTIEQWPETVEILNTLEKPRLPGSPKSEM